MINNIKDFLLFQKKNENNEFDINVMSGYVYKHPELGKGITVKDEKNECNDNEIMFKNFNNIISKVLKSDLQLTESLNIVNEAIKHESLPRPKIMKNIKLSANIKNERDMTLLWPDWKTMNYEDIIIDKYGNIRGNAYIKDFKYKNPKLAYLSSIEIAKLKYAMIEYLKLPKTSDYWTYSYIELHNKIFGTTATSTSTATSTNNSNTTATSTNNSNTNANSAPAVSSTPAANPTPKPAVTPSSTPNTASNPAPSSTFVPTPNPNPTPVKSGSKINIKADNFFDDL